MPTKFFAAPDVKQLAEELIPKHHTHLQGMRIEYVFSDKVALKGGKQIWGSMRLVTNLGAFLAATTEEQQAGEFEPFFCMTISLPIWEKLSHEKRLALVDHELCHAWVHEEKPMILPHDLEEFSAIVKRHGLWREDIQEFMDICTEKKEEQPSELNAFKAKVSKLLKPID